MNLKDTSTLHGFTGGHDHQCVLGSGDQPEPQAGSRVAEHGHGDQHADKPGDPRASPQVAKYVQPGPLHRQLPVGRVDEEQGQLDRLLDEGGGQV